MFRAKQKRGEFKQTTEMFHGILRFGVCLSVNFPFTQKRGSSYRLGGVIPIDRGPGGSGGQQPIAVVKRPIAKSRSDP
jgi:hypothetical protein